MVDGIFNNFVDMANRTAENNAVKVGTITVINTDGTYDIEIEGHYNYAKRIRSKTGETFSIGDLVRLEKIGGQGVYEIVGRTGPRRESETLTEDMLQKLLSGEISGASEISYSPIPGFSPPSVQEALTKLFGMFYPGMIVLWNYSTAPPGWAFCDGIGGRPSVTPYDGKKWIIKLAP